MSRDQHGVKGHIRSIEVKNRFFTKKSFNSSTLQGIVMQFRDMNCLDIVYKSYGVTKMFGVIWGHKGQKRSNYFKNHQKSVSAKQKVAELFDFHR